ncbi:redoxin domain-containing protein, partial [Flavobacterium sp. 9AF]|uniref:TlpA family protein disulfide reductase n=1 Tax=Flavobacterium sp. 9AF TaxID=2653142 RepID=UPI0013599659
MIQKNIKYFLPLSILALSTLFSCKKVFQPDNYVAYFGGEIINPQDNYVLFMKDEAILDTIYLDKNNRFLHKFDSLAPGLYTFKHSPEFQYIYFDKNDSLMIRLNSLDFDNSLSFCGRGDEKNNFLIDLYIKNESDRSNLYDILDKDLNTYSNAIDSSYKNRKAYYLKRKSEVNWSDNFDAVAQAGVDMHYFYKKELYPYAHEYKTGENICPKLPDNYYAYRKNLNLNNPELGSFSPFIKYVSAFLNNVTYEKGKCKLQNKSLEKNIKQLNIVDTLLKDQKIKNIVLNNIAYMYLIEEQNMYNNKQFIDRYIALSSDKEKHREVTQIYNAVQNLKIGNKLPKIDLIDKNSQPVSLNDYIQNKETVIFFWTTHAESHIKFVHEKVFHLQEKYPSLNFIAININDSKENWLNTFKKYNFKNVVELKATDFDDIKENWVITKVHRTII